VHEKCLLEYKGQKKRKKSKNGAFASHLKVFKYHENTEGASEKWPKDAKITSGH
jgi:hypothetical protein